MYGIYLSIASLVLLFARASSALGVGSLASLDVDTGLGFVQVPVQQTGQQSNRAPTIRHKATDKFSEVDLGALFILYSINISIAGQDTTVMLDTGSFELWVNPDCSKAAPYIGADVPPDDVLHSPDFCKSIGRYDPALSPTAKNLQQGGHLLYGDNATVDFNSYTDNVRIGSLEISEQQFGVANASHSYAVGMMGMGPNVDYGYNSSSKLHNLVLDSMASQGLIASRAFSLDLRKYGDKTGSIVFGGLDQKKFQGSLQTLPLESPKTPAGVYVNGTPHETITTYGYYVTVQSLNMTKPDHGSSTQYSQGDFSMLLDSGTNMVLTPEGVSSRICNDLGGIWDNVYGVCIVSCDLKDKSGGLDVSFDNKTIRVNFEDFVTEVQVSGYTGCILTVRDTTVHTDPPTYILGTPFLRAAYAVFDWDNQQVHLAQAADCGSQVVAIGTGPGAVPTGVGCEESAALPSVRSSVGSMVVVVMASILALV